jgi:PAS domain S-box-containing protein
MKDTSGRYMLANHYYEKLLGVPAADICGKTDAHLFSPEYAAVYAHNEAQVLKSGAPMQFEEVFPFMGNVHTRLANRFPLFDASGGTEGVCTICTDITARMKQEEALRRTEKLAAAGRLAASIAHEINNPLEGLMNLVFLVQRQPELADQTREMLAMTEQELNRVSHIARQTLAFYQEASRPSHFDLEETFKSLVDLYGYKIRQREIHLHLSVRGSSMVRAVRGELRQAFANLLANAIDASQTRGQIHIRIREVRGTGGASRSGVRVTVADKGCGIPRQNRARIFEAFFTTKGDGTGTGLGLWVTKNILEKHRATMLVRSSVAPGASGTTFSVFVPHEADPNAANPPEEDSEETRTRGTGKDLTVA